MNKSTIKNMLQRTKLNLTLLKPYRSKEFSLDYIPAPELMSKYSSKSEKATFAYKKIMKKLKSYVGTGPIGPNKHWEYPWVIKNLMLEKGLRILDAGCGRSPLQFFLADIGMQVSAIDPCENVGWHGIDRRLQRKYGLDIDYRVEDMDNISYEDEAFDRVICISVLEHCYVERPGREPITGFTEEDKKYHARMMREMARVLKKGGLLIVTVDISIPGNGQFNSCNIDIQNLIQSSGLTLLSNGEKSGSYYDNNYEMPKLMSLTDLNIFKYKGSVGTSLGLIFRK